MDLSVKWLKDFVDIEIEPKKFAADLTMSGSKVESWEKEGGEISNVVTGRVEEISHHPDSDHLLVCKVNIGKPEPLQIVTGAANLKTGDIVPVALDNSSLPGGRKIKKGKLRGVLSEGMLCSLTELGLSNHDFPYAAEDGIFVIEEPCEPGQDVCSAIGLDDVKVEFEITPNRPDCLSIIGLARETAATYGLPLKKLEPAVRGGAGNISDLLSVEVSSPELCPRYVARIVRNVKIAPSPRWMRERLRACGVRPINNLVDITNYVMLEYGQPMHAFDLRCVGGARINVRTARPGEKIMTLDGVERSLSENMLVIADAEKPVAVAGIMGGEYSGIMDDTSAVVFESACFSGAGVRVTAKKLGMRTESSSRFEKGLDPQNCLPAVNRACELAELLGAGEVADGAIDVDNSDKTPLVLDLNIGWINKFIGIEASADEMRRILTSLDFICEGNKITVPSFRSDVRHKADLSEEIARFYGYDKIPVTQVRGAADGRLTPRQSFDRKVSEVLVALGADEIMTYSFISPKYYDKILLPADSPLRKSVVIANPLGEDTSVMRKTAVPSMLETLSRNYNNRNASALLFELAKEYIPVEGRQLPDEPLKCVVGLYGAGADFFAIKGIVQALLGEIRLQDYLIEAETGISYLHPGRAAALKIKGESAGHIGEVHPSALKNYGIDVKAYIAYLDMSALFENISPEINYAPMPRFPAVSRDLAIICGEETSAAEIEAVIKKAFGAVLEKLSLFDLYRGAQIGKGKKSMAYNLTLRSKERTLSDSDIEPKLRKALKGLEEIGAGLRG
ncbi:MAG: phenylalanine--tRNA ligase subunit beta [Oscillospiraceae bacterium]|jgi:phenylalanyl-tRNA synthetase beta chain|nr:phenylalanine--tRNA ligase subunit beta [Oscillospiraceae bacterium]